MTTVSGPRVQRLRTGFDIQFAGLLRRLLFGYLLHLLGLVVVVLALAYRLLASLRLVASSRALVGIGNLDQGLVLVVLIVVIGVLGGLGLLLDGSWLGGRFAGRLAGKLEVAAAGTLALIAFAMPDPLGGHLRNFR